LICRILIFAKAPDSGKVKTRLIPALGAEGAALLARQMLETTLAEAAASGVGPVELCTDPDPESPAWKDLTRTADEVSAQGGGNLGARLARAARRTIELGESVILIGTDCPGLSSQRLRVAAERLDHHDAVINPASDGGYVLLGLSRFDPSLFKDMAWSTPSVAEQTIARIERLGWSLHVGETLHDIDEPADLEQLRPGS
jgi:rSAM/selenodomain-associated transferase 1